MILKNKFLILICALSLGIFSCGEYEEDAFDFDNITSQYVDMSTTGGAITIDTTMANGEVVAVVDSVNTALADLGISSSETVRLRVARTSDTKVDVTISGDITESLSVTIPAGDFSADFLVAIPFASSLTGSATASISGVDSGLTVGRTTASGKAIDNTSATISWNAE